MSRLVCPVNPEHEVPAGRTRCHCGAVARPAPAPDLFRRVDRGPVRVTKDTR